MGKFDYFPNIASKGRIFPPAPAFYVQRPLGGETMHDVILELAKAEGLNIANMGKIKDTDLLESFLETQAGKSLTTKSLRCASGAPCRRHR